MAQPVIARPASPPSVGLIPSARTRFPDEGARWQDGLAFQPEGCNAADIEDPCAVSNREAPDGPGEIAYTPFLVWAADKCSTWGFESRDYAARARRMLEACEGFQIEQELWNGTLAQASDWPNNRLTDIQSSDTITAGPTEVTDALSVMEQALAGCNCGQQAMIHAPRNVVTLWNQQNLLRREGNLILTINDTIVVPGAGYDGSGPSADDQAVNAAVDGSVWVYGTGMVDVRRSEIEIVPNDITQSDRANNEVTVFAQRMAAAYWDGCCHFAAQVDAEMPNIAGAGS